MEIDALFHTAWHHFVFMLLMQSLRTSYAQPPDSVTERHSRPRDRLVIAAHPCGGLFAGAWCSGPDLALGPTGSGRAHTCIDLFCRGAIACSHFAYEDYLRRSLGVIVSRSCMPNLLFLISLQPPSMLYTTVHILRYVGGDAPARLECS